jgi:methyl coenzyme M reductase subunit D
LITRNDILKIINNIPNFKEKAIESSKEYMKDTWCFAYNVTENRFCNRNVSWTDYCKKDYFGITIDSDGRVFCHELFEEYLPLLPKAINYIEI